MMLYVKSVWCVLPLYDTRWSCVFSESSCAHAAQKIKLLTPNNPVWQYMTNHKLTKYLQFFYFTGFFDDAKSDFQQALKLNPDFEDAKVSLQQTILDQQHKINRGY